MIESLHPKQFFHDVPSMAAPALVTKNLRKSEWSSNPEALQAVRKEAEGLRKNQDLDDGSVTTVSNLRYQSKMSGNKVKTTNLCTVWSEALGAGFNAPSLQR